MHIAKPVDPAELANACSARACFTNARCNTLVVIVVVDAFSHLTVSHSGSLQSESCVVAHCKSDRWAASQHNYPHLLERMGFQIIRKEIEAQPLRPNILPSFKVVVSGKTP